jgi:hypothetical protein
LRRSPQDGLLLQNPSLVAVVTMDFAKDSTHQVTVIPGRALARTRNLEIPGSMLRIAPE